MSSSLPNIFSSKSADAFEREGKNEPILNTCACMKANALNVEAAAIPGPAGAGCQIDKARISRHSEEIAVS